MSTDVDPLVRELDEVRADLVAEHSSLDLVVRTLDEGAWSTPTPAPGWTVTDQIGHLSYFDAAAAAAVLDPPAFQRGVKDLYAAALDPGIDAFTLGSFRALDVPGRLARWRHHRETLNHAASTLSSTDRVAWYGPSMGAASFVRARLMETWAHGVDVSDALGVERVPSERLRHVAHLGYITRKWSYAVRGETPPPGQVRVELTGPSGSVWAWGPEDADDTVFGPAEDFCLVVTQRRHVDDTTLASGDLGRDWLLRAQAFAGGPTTGPEPRRS